MSVSLRQERQERPRLFPLKSLLLLLLAELYQLLLAEASLESESSRQDISWVLSVESVRRMVPLLQQAEAATRLQGILTGRSASKKAPKTILLHQSPVPVHLQLLLLHSARAAFAVEERLLHGILESHYRTLLFLVHAASSMGGEPRDVLRLSLERAGLVTGVMDINSSELNGTPAVFHPAGQVMFTLSFIEAVTSAEAFVRDIQHAEVAAGGVA